MLNRVEFIQQYVLNARNSYGHISGPFYPDAHITAASKAWEDINSVAAKDSSSDAIYRRLVETKMPKLPTDATA